MSPRALILTPSGEIRRIVPLFVTLLFGSGVFLESCSTIRRLGLSEGEDILKFSHADHMIHVSNCADCHFDSDTEEISRPTHKSCVECHAAAVDDRPGEKACLECHHVLDPKSIRVAERPDYENADFDHETHEEVSCAACHGNVAQAGLMGSLHGKIKFPRMEDCLSCHEPGLAQTPEANCLYCHFAIDSNTMPDNHENPQWEFVHGMTSREDPDLCMRCHEPAKDCESCHSMERPRTHTASFRARSHGFHAMDDPINCETCHTQEFCEVCHRTTEPINHTSSFKNKPFLHCATCHMPLDEGNRCAVCHVGQPHEGVRAKPPPPDLVEFGLIDPSEPCLPCHPVDLVPITHPYNTIDSLECIICHRPI